MGVFDSIAVQDASGKILMTLMRSGPVERIEFQTDAFGRIKTDVDGKPLIFETLLPEFVAIPPTFGINASNQLYYDPSGPAPGELARLWVVPATQQLIFDTKEAD